MEVTTKEVEFYISILHRFTTVIIGNIVKRESLFYDDREQLF